MDWTQLGYREGGWLNKVRERTWRTRGRRTGGGEGGGHLSGENKPVWRETQRASEINTLAPRLRSWRIPFVLELASAHCRPLSKCGPACHMFSGRYRSKSTNYRRSVRYTRMDVTLLYSRTGCPDSNAVPGKANNAPCNVRIAPTRPDSRQRREAVDHDQRAEPTKYLERIGARR